MSEGLVVTDAPVDARGLRAGQVRYINERPVLVEEIIKDVLDEPCEICGAPTRKVPGKALLAKDSKDEYGRNIVLMVCAKCMTTTKKKTKKAAP